MTKNEVLQVLSKVSLWSASHSCTKLQQHAELKLRQLIFVGHDFALKFSGQNGPQMTFLKFCGNSMLGTFLIFCINLQHQGLKLTHDFLGDNSCFVVFWQTVAQKEFFMTNRCIEFFWFSVQNGWKAANWVKHTLTKLLFSDFFKSKKTQKKQTDQNLSQKNPIRPKFRFFKFYEEWKPGMFLIISKQFLSFFRETLFCFFWLKPS